MTARPHSAVKQCDIATERQHGTVKQCNTATVRPHNTVIYSTIHVKMVRLHGTVRQQRDSETAT